MNRFEPPPGQSGGQSSPGGSWRQRLASRFLSLAPRQRQAVLIGAPLLVIVIVAAAAVLLATSGGESDEQATANANATATASATQGQGEGLLQEELTQIQKLEQQLLAERGTPQGVSGTNPDAPVPGGEGDRLIIPKISVDAPMTMRVVAAADGIMQNPEGPKDVAWYDFSAISGLGGRPGVGGNTVISGHVDYHDYGPAVFWDLRKIEPGDEVIIHLRDGSEYKYSVQWNRTIDPAAISWNDVVAATPQESVTMITCAGTFDSSTRSYDQRRVIWATRVG
jgi:LPXTG-site transpeptidase (sortase) family protein